MRKVVDSNFLGREELRKYFSQSPSNHVVLTDYASMEAYKGDTLVTIHKSMEILSAYPQQVIILKNTHHVCRLNGRGSGLQRRLIDDKETKNFSTYCKNLAAAQRGDKALTRRLLEHGRVANEHLDAMLADGAYLPGIFQDISKTFTQSELYAIRKEGPYTSEMIDKFIKTIMWIAAHSFKDHKQVTEAPDVSVLPNYFIFRFSICAYLLALDWISHGGQKDIKPERLRNDIVDINFATYATYFDGILSFDKKVVKLHAEAELLLEFLFNTKTGARR